jgi:hypothetical protein
MRPLVEQLAQWGEYEDRDYQDDCVMALWFGSNLARTLRTVRQEVVQVARQLIPPILTNRWAALGRPHVRVPPVLTQRGVHSGRP